MVILDMANASNDVDRYIDNMIKSFLNNQHRQTTEEFLNVRIRYEKNHKNRKLSNYTLRNDVQSLLALDVFLKNKPYKQATHEDLVEFEEYLREKYTAPGKSKKRNKTVGLSDTTIEQYLIHIKRFYKYLYNKEEYKKGHQVRKNLPYPECVAWISSASTSKEIFKEDLPSEDDILKILEVCENERDQAMFGAGFYDAGFRCGELISLNCDSVTIDKVGVKFVLPRMEDFDSGEQKTGRGIVRLFIMPSSTQYMKVFLNHHPFYKFRDKFNVPLFYTRDMRTYLKVLDKANKGTVTQADFEKLRLSRPGIEGILRKYCKMAGIRNYRPHDLRHASATRAWEMGFNEPELRVRYRWSKKSKMPSRYIHTTDEAIENKVKVITGFEEPEEIDKSKLVTIECWNCQEENVPTNKFCSRCGSNLNPSKEEITMTATETGLGVQDMIKDKEFMMKMMNMMAEEWARLQQEETKD
ncbi:MAG: tyrosine-type recombinase/integrase [Thermoplasmatales archaeon]|nr:tyrosine-type recombinase/integrase [Thermoplasmatales archaeon]